MISVRFVTQMRKALATLARNCYANEVPKVKNGIERQTVSGCAARKRKGKRRKIER